MCVGRKLPRKITSQGFYTLQKQDPKNYTRLPCNILTFLNISQMFYSEPPITGVKLDNRMLEYQTLVLCDPCHEKTDLKVFVGVIPQEGWARPRAPILLLV